MILLNMVKGLGAVVLLFAALVACLLLAMRDRLGGAARLQRIPARPRAGFPARPALYGAAVPRQG